MALGILVEQAVHKDNRSKLQTPNNQYNIFFTLSIYKDIKSIYILNLSLNFVSIKARNMMTKVDLKKIFYMDHLIHIRNTGTAAEFAEKLGIARSTFFEYMDYMRNELNIAILYDRSAKTYYYNGKGLYDTLKQWIA